MLAMPIQQQFDESLENGSTLRLECRTQCFAQNKHEQDPHLGTVRISSEGSKLSQLSCYNHDACACDMVVHLSQASHQFEPCSVLLALHRSIKLLLPDILAKKQ